MFTGQALAAPVALPRSGLQGLAWKLYSGQQHFLKVCDQVRPGLPQGVRQGGGTTSNGSSPVSLLSETEESRCVLLHAALLSIFSQELNKEIKTLSLGLESCISALRCCQLL